LTIFAVNRSLDSSMNLECEFRGFSDFQIIEHIVYESENKKARNTEENPLDIIPHKHGNAQIDGNKLVALLPKLSWNVIRLKRKETK
jgi:alpha-N-arabinofuranosidase